MCLSDNTRRNPARLFPLLAIIPTLLCSLPGPASAQQPCTAAPSGIISWWPFDEASGTIAADIAGTTPAAYFGSPTTAAGKVGRSLHFNGSTDFVAAADRDQWAFGSGGFTIEFWANFDSPGDGDLVHAGDIFIGNDNGPTNTNKWFFALGGGVLHFTVWNDEFPPPNIYLVRAPFSPVVGQWYHLAVTKSGQLFTIYVNGVPIGSEISPSPISNASAPLTIGQAESLGFMSGRLDEMTVYNRALSTAELQSIYTAGSAGKCRPLSATAITPTVGGNAGAVTVTATGEGLIPGTTIRLARAGQPDIPGIVREIAIDGKSLTASFDLAGAFEGAWNVILARPGLADVVLKDGFIIAPVRPAQVWVDIVGRGAIRPNRDQQFTVLYGNRGSVDAVGVPLWIAGIPKGATWKLDFALEPLPPIPGAPSFDFSTVPIEVKGPDDIRIPLYLPRIPAGFTGALTFTLNVNSTAPFHLEAWTTVPQFPPVIAGALTSSMTACQKSVIDLLMELVGLLPGGDCAKAAASLVTEYLGRLIEGSKGPFSLRQLDVGLWSTALDGARCLLDVLPFGAILDLVQDFYDAYSIHHAGFSVIKDCFPDLDPFDGADLPITVVSSYDPNDKRGSLGAGAAAFISRSEPLRYSILFENKETATAPAQKVVITDQLDVARLDLSTFSLGPISFGRQEVTIPPGRTAYSTYIDLRPAKDLLVAVDAALNPVTGLVTWRFTSLDPATLTLPADPFAGFLPPNRQAPEGEGSVVFTVMANSAEATGTQIRNKASIVFDTNPAMPTPEWQNTIDATPPVSHIASLAAIQPQLAFPVQWQGSDIGSGISGFTIYVSDNGGPFTAWVTSTSSTGEIFSGQAGHTYGFYSIAKDFTGNSEAVKDAAEAATSVAVTNAPALSISKAHTGNFARGQQGATYTLTVANSAAGAPTSGTVTVTETAPAGLTLVSMSGTGWRCTTLPSCTRSDVLAAGASYPALTVTVNVGATAPPLVTNRVTVQGGGSAAASASDPTIVGPPTGTAPVTMDVSPVIGTAGTQTFLFTYSDSKGAADFAQLLARFSVFDPSVQSKACEVRYDAASNLLQLHDDTGSTWLPGATPGSPGALANSQCTINLLASSVAAAGAQGKNLILSITFNASFKGMQTIWAAAYGQGGTFKQYMALGAWWPNATLLTSSQVTPSYRLYDGQGTRSHHYTSDMNEYTVLQSRGWTGEGTALRLYAAPTVTSAQFSTIPSYRIFVSFADRNFYDHFWTTDRNEYLTLTRSFPNVYTGEGIANFLMSAPGGNAAVYNRLACCDPPQHLWTADSNEWTVLQTRGWTLEGRVGYVYQPTGPIVPPDSPSPVPKPRSAGPRVPKFVVVSSADYGLGPVAPGQMVSLFGVFSDVPEVRINGERVTTWRANEREIRLLMPGNIGNAARIEVDGEAAELETVAVRPGIFTFDLYGKGQTIAQNADGTPNGPDAPGTEITFYATGLGRAAPAVFVAGRPARVVSTDTRPDGRTALRIVVPDGVEHGAANVTVRAQDSYSQPGPVVFVK